MPVSPVRRSLMCHPLTTATTTTTTINYLFHASPLQHILSLHDRFPKPHQEHRPTWPQLRSLIVRCDLGLEAASVADTLDDARHKGGTVEHAHFLWNTNIGIDEWIVVRDHVLVRRLRGDRVLESIGRPLEEHSPEGPVNQM